MHGTPLTSLHSHFSLLCDIELVINPSPSSLSNAVAMGVNIDLHRTGFAFFSPPKKQNPYLHLLPHLSAEQASSAHLNVVDPPDHHPCFTPFLPSWERNAGKDKTTSKDAQM